MEKIKVLFICIHNSARSQMAEAFLNRLGSDRFIGESAGLTPGTLNPLVVEVMGELGFDISGHPTRSVYDLLAQGRTFDYTVTLCDEAAGEKCPIFPGRVTRLHWSFEDPSAFGGSHDEKLARVREIRDTIKERIEQFVQEV
jgi:arsenate reductase (thioredoxin)